MKNNLYHINCVLLQACETNDLQLLRDTLEQGVSVGDIICDLALITAAINGYAQIVEELINAGVNMHPFAEYPNNIAYEGTNLSALNIAIEYNHVEIANMLRYAGMS